MKLSSRSWDKHIIDDHYMRAPSEDSHQTDQRSVVMKYSLKCFDIFAYFIGCCVRLQTVMLGVLLFNVETDNLCIVEGTLDKPIPREYLPANLDDIPGGFANMSYIFETVLTLLFITSSITSILYIVKLVYVCRNQHATDEEYNERVAPKVRHYKIWNAIFGLSHLACCTIFMTHAGRVCSGWMVGNLPDEERETLDRSTYLWARGGYFVVASVFGLCNLIGFLIVGKNAIN